MAARRRCLCAPPSSLRLAPSTRHRAQVHWASGHLRCPLGETGSFPYSTWGRCPPPSHGAFCGPGPQEVFSTSPVQKESRSIKTTRIPVCRAVN
eukprot:3564794-Prymnesium_polylepis.1